MGAQDGDKPYARVVAAERRQRLLSTISRQREAPMCNDITDDLLISLRNDKEP